MIELDRRNALAIFSATLLTVPTRRLTIATGDTTHIFASAAEANGAPVPKNCRVACCAPGSHRPLLYEKRAAVDADFVARFPEASFVSREGQGYGLTRGEVSVEAFGAVGDGRTNDQAAIQKAIDYAAEAGIGTVRFGCAAYAVWATLRTSAPNRNDAYDGLPIIVRRTVALVGRRPGRSTLYFRNVDGREFERAWQLVSGMVWRGAGIFLKGLDWTESAHAEPPSITLVDLNLDGGCAMGSYFGFPARLSDGDGWDLTHKALWAEQDRAAGDWTIQRCKVSRFRGELFYQGGEYHGAVIMRDVEFCESNADLLNPCGTSIDIEGGNFHDGNSGFEGWGGRRGRIVNSVFRNCRSIGMMQGGRPYTASHERGDFARPTPFQRDVKPWLTLDVRIDNCGPVYLGSWVRGRIDMTDSVIAFSAAVFHSISDVDLKIVARIRTKQLPAAISLTGGSGGPPLLNAISIRLKLEDERGSGFKEAVAHRGDTTQVRIIITSSNHLRSLHHYDMGL